VFDYDGTLVQEAERFQGPSAAVVGMLVRLLSTGGVLGIATGRGRSAREELRSQLPKATWANVVMGYYNGAVIAPLSDRTPPDRRSDVGDALQAAHTALTQSGTLLSLATITPRKLQITVEPKHAARTVEVWDAAAGALRRSSADGVMVRSSHSIDVLVPGISKLAVVEAVRRLAGVGVDAPILRIGDRAAPPGNDALLLAGLDGVSVDEVDSDPDGAWNFAAPGLRGVPATLAFCSMLGHITGGGLRVMLPTDEP
jgi:hydroxymethylpyrimidine pyrophosphatase-like HAD family hydrolase